MVRYVILFFIVIFISLVGESQELNDIVPISKNAISLELIGTSCTLFSIHYDRIIKTTHSSYYSMDAGLGYLPPLSKNLINKVIGTSFAFDWNSRLYKKNHITGGIGLSYSDGMFQYGLDNEIKKSFKGLFASLRIGYKYQKTNKGMFYKIMATPIFKLYEFSNINDQTLNIFPLIGFSAGYSF